MNKQTYDLEERLLEYSVRIIKIVEQLPNTRVGNHVAGQLLKSGTSPYPNHGEAQAAESQKDFIHKLRCSMLDVRCSMLIFSKFILLLYDIIPSIGNEGELFECDS